jgi:hypothetical protein
MATIPAGRTIPRWHGWRNGAVPSCCSSPRHVFPFHRPGVWPGIEMEVESMGRSRILITEFNGQLVLLNCFGELRPFDEVAVTLRFAE